MIKIEPLVSASPPDQHEDDARGDVQAPDRTGDAALHIEPPRGPADGRPAQWLQDNLFFYHFIFVCLPSQHLKEHPVLTFRFLLCHKGLKDANPLSAVLDATFRCQRDAASRSYLFSYGEINEYIYFYLVIFTKCKSSRGWKAILLPQYMHVIY